MQHTPRVHDRATSLQTVIIIGVSEPPWQKEFSPNLAFHNYEHVVQCAKKITRYLTGTCEVRTLASEVVPIDCCVNFNFI